MSQIYGSGSSSGPIPPTVPTSFVTDVNSPSIPAANIENVIGGHSSDNSDSGIQTDGSSGGNTLTIQRTNFLTGAVTTANAVPTNIITFPLSATPGVYGISGTIVAYDTTDIAGGSFEFSIAVRSTGAAAVIIGAEVDSAYLEPAVTDIDISVSVSVNSFLLGVVGLAATSINWNASFTYRFVS